MKPENKNLDALIQQIISLCHPEKIYLFGSRARNEANKESDFDLLIVMPDQAHKRKTAQEIYQKIDSLGLSFDILVTTSSDLEKHKNNPGLIYKTILHEGKILYAA